MRIPRLRLGLRLSTLLVAVAAFALGIWAEKSRVRCEMLLGHAETYRTIVEHNRSNVKIIESWLKEHRETGQQPAFMQFHTSKNGMEGLRTVLNLSRSTAERAERFRSQCQWAAFLPVLPVPAGLFEKRLVGFDLSPPSPPRNSGRDNLATPAWGD